MAVRIKRRIFDVQVKDYKSASPSIEILTESPSPSKIKAQPHDKHSFVQRWYLSLQGDDSPINSETILSQNDGPNQRIYRYDWAFGITLLDGFWWDWQADLRENSSIAVHLVLEPIGNASEVIPVGATLSALHPSRNSKGLWETMWPKIPKAAAEMAKIGASAVPPLAYASTGLMLASNILDSYTENEKNWFLYQFLDEKLKCPTVEWRINGRVIREYGPLLRGTLFTVFYGSEEAHPGRIRVLLRPQVGYFDKDDLNFVIPTNAQEDEQVDLEIKPKDAPPTLETEHAP